MNGRTGGWWVKAPNSDCGRRGQYQELVNVLKCRYYHPQGCGDAWSLTSYTHRRRTLDGLVREHSAPADHSSHLSRHLHLLVHGIIAPYPCDVLDMVS